MENQIIVDTIIQENNLINSDEVSRELFRNKYQYFSGYGDEVDRLNDLLIKTLIINYGS